MLLVNVAHVDGLIILEGAMDKTKAHASERHTYHSIILVSSGLSCPGSPTTIQTMGVNITTIAYLKGFNHRNWVNHHFNGGGSPGHGHK